jgi:gluconate 2-dehydrogenase gamma chain
MKRRAFLRGASAALSVGPLNLGAMPEAEGPSRMGRTLDPEQWSVLEAVQDHLLPSEPDAPGSRDIEATAYLDRTLADPRFDPDIKRFIFNGIGWLEEIARQEHRLPFHRIQPARREELLERIARTGAGERWLSTLVTYTLEALLADPLYGGNPDGIGWTWLEHDPGQPRPTADKIYGRLGRA